MDFATLENANDRTMETKNMDSINLENVRKP